MHYTHQLEEILRKAAKVQRITFKGQKILIFPDYPPAVVKRRALFKRARELLKDKPGVRFGMQYPAKLWVTVMARNTFSLTQKERRSLQSSTLEQFQLVDTRYMNHLDI